MEIRNDTSVKTVSNGAIIRSGRGRISTRPILNAGGNDDREVAARVLPRTFRKRDFNYDDRRLSLVDNHRSGRGRRAGGVETALHVLLHAGRVQFLSVPEQRRTITGVSNQVKVGFAP